MVDLLVYSVGYETRSGFAASSVNASSRIGLVFDKHHLHSFEANLRRAKDRHDVLLSTAEVRETFSAVLVSVLDSLHSSDEIKTVAVDVSSMTRRLMATVLKELYSLAQNRSLAIRVLYAAGEYLPPPPEGASFIDFAPIPGCEGWTVFPERPLSVVLGLGYEADQAIGAIEYLDPSGIWTFLPKGADPQFFKDLLHANDALWPLVDPSHQREYPIDDPYLVFSELRGLLASLSQRSRVVIVPGGPKLFSALSILGKFELGEEVSIWRASTHEYSEPRDVQPTGHIVEFDYKMPRLLEQEANRTMVA